MWEIMLVLRFRSAHYQDWPNEYDDDDNDENH